MNETLINVLIEKTIALVKLQSEIDDIKAEIEKDLPEEGFKNDIVTISRSKESSSVGIDYKAFEKKEPQLYADLMKDYQKTTVRKASVRYCFNKEGK